MKKGQILIVNDRGTLYKIKVLEVTKTQVQVYNEDTETTYRIDIDDINTRVFVREVIFDGGANSMEMEIHELALGYLHHGTEEEAELANIILNSIQDYEKEHATGPGVPGDQRDAGSAV